jgi:hypothetical protein
LQPASGASIVAQVAPQDVAKDNSCLKKVCNAVMSFFSAIGQFVATKWNELKSRFSAKPTKGLTTGAAASDGSVKSADEFYQSIIKGIISFNVEDVRNTEDPLASLDVLQKLLNSSPIQSEEEMSPLLEKELICLIAKYKGRLLQISKDLSKPQTREILKQTVSKIVESCDEFLKNDFTNGNLHNFLKVYVNEDIIMAKHQLGMTF